MNILFLSLGRVDNLNEQGIYNDLLKQFSLRNHNLYIVSPRERRTGLSTNFSKDEYATYLKVQTGNITKANIIEKGLSTLLIEQQYLKAINSYLENIRFDLILYVTPPITFSNIVKRFKNRDNAISYLLLKDIFPQNAVDIGMLGTKNPIFKFFKRKERELYDISDYIGCMSPANLNYILENNPEVTEDKIEVSPNTITPIEIDITQHEIDEIRKKYNLPKDKNIFIYGGNLGKPQGIDFLIECIKRNEQNRSSFFLIVGSGTEFNKLQSYFTEYKPRNAKLLNQLPKEDYELLANTCDVGLIFLDKRFTIPNFPSRLLSYMQASMPVIAATDPNTDIGTIIEEGNFGFACISDNVEKFNDLVIKLSNEKLQKELGKNAREYLENNYTSEHSYEIIMKHFE